MAKYCTQCGKETGDGGFCIHCGAPVDNTPEGGGPVTSQTLPPAQPDQVLTEGAAQGALAGPPPRKKHTGLAVTAVLVVIVVMVSLVVWGLLSLFKTATKVHVTDAYVTTDPVESGTPEVMLSVTPDTWDVNLYGEADNLNEGTILEMKWYDVTGVPVEFDSVLATVDPETGTFYGESTLPTGDFGLAFSGEYAVEIHVNGEEEPDYTAVFSVYSDPLPDTAAPPINDAYMVAERQDGVYVPATGYDQESDMIVMLSFAEMATDTQWRFTWLHKTDGEWSVVSEDTEFSPVSEAADAGLYLNGISPKDPWEPGDYRVEVYLSTAPDAPSAVVDYFVDDSGAVTQNIFFDDVVMSTGVDEEGYPVDNVSSYPVGTEAFYCSFYVGGVSEPTEISWVWYNEYGNIAAPQSDTVEEDTYYWVAFGDEGDGVPFDPGDYRIVLYAGEEEYEVQFAVADTSVALDEGSEPLSFDAWADWNGWLKTFTEGRLSPFSEGLPPDSELIDFGVLYNYFYNEDMYATLDEYGMCWLDKSAFDYTIWWFFDTEVEPASTENVMYEGESYGYKVPEEEMPYHFPQVRGLYKQEGEGYIVEFDVYSAPVGFEDFNGDHESWEESGTVPEYLGEMRARVRWVSDGDTQRRVLLSYEQAEPVE